MAEECHTVGSMFNVNVKIVYFSLNGVNFHMIRNLSVAVQTRNFSEKLSSTKVSKTGKIKF